MHITPGIPGEFPENIKFPCLARGTVGDRGIPVLPQWGTSWEFPGNSLIIPHPQGIPQEITDNYLMVTHSLGIHWEFPDSQRADQIS